MFWMGVAIILYVLGAIDFYMRRDAFLHSSEGMPYDWFDILLWPGNVMLAFIEWVSYK